ncbi:MULTISPECIES: enolase C-terminal domain-like protein [Variovorax]|uniref:Enolase C-terminal domain-containing protein n=1 Tax=Variovorax paradoxus (strain S110) TaxID=543728 RepID=C5CUT1_VARPS|nr:enolase C-terminal domain-like protein [Variovorax paradoxus]
MDAPRFHVEEIRFAERDVALRLPFRFGAATVTACPQVYVRARIRFENGRTAEGCAAEMMVPKWFDKNPALTNEQNFEQLRFALRDAREAYLAEDEAQTAWTHFASNYAALQARAKAKGLQALVASYGPALIDRALMDALCLHTGQSFAAAMSANLCGIDVAGSGLADDLAGFGMSGFLAGRSPRKSIAARHTVGLADAIDDSDPLPDAPADGLPTTLAAAVQRYGLTHFKLKLCGHTAQDIARLERIARVIDGHAQLVTLDGNEQYADAGDFAVFLDRMLSTPVLWRLAQKTAFVEQPIRRDAALRRDVAALGKRIPLLIDESDAMLDAFVQARALGYTGVSSKSCKGFYKSVVNAARCVHWNASEKADRYFLSGEDLTMQAGIGVQQDLALVGWLGLSHVERNGHHYVNGLAAVPEAEQQALLKLHPGLYEPSDGAVRLAICGGQLALSPLATAPGFATGKPGAGISWDAMRSVY